MESYPSIFGLHHRAVKDIFSQPVVVQEKIDGSQFNFTLTTFGEWIFRSKGAVLDMVSPDKNFAAAVEFAQTKPLMPGWVYHAEALQKPKHNVLAYSRVPIGNFILFDVNRGGYDYLNPYELLAEGRRLGVEIVRLFAEWDPQARFPIEDAEEMRPRLYEFLEHESCLGGTKVEGVVIKSLTLFGADKKPLMAKLVRDEYKEAHKREWKAGPSVVEQIVETLRNENRWRKSIQHLAERGELVNAPQDIGPLLREINQDILKEESDWIKEKLMEKCWKEIARGVTRGFPEWYKQQVGGKVDDIQS